MGGHVLNKVEWIKLVWITSVITEPEPAIIHFKNTRKSGFACITLLSFVRLALTVKEQHFVFSIKFPCSIHFPKTHGY